MDSREGRWRGGENDGRGADAMLPAHASPLAAFTCAILASRSARLMSESARHSHFRRKWPSLSAPNGYTQTDTTAITIFVAAQPDDEPDGARITSKRMGINHDRDHSPTDAPVDRSGSAGSPTRYLGNGQGICLGGRPAAALTAIGQLVPIANISRREHDGTYPDGKQFRVLRPRVTGGYFGNDGAFLQRFPVRAVGRRL